jgi:hypothetical protein
VNVEHGKLENEEAERLSRKNIRNPEVNYIIN